MKKIIQFPNGRSVTIEAVPECGEDFCDTCGDCLHCYEGDPCYPDGGEHLWIVYANGIRTNGDRCGISCEYYCPDYCKLFDKIVEDARCTECKQGDVG